jgi:hypothetical protein
MPQIAQPPPSLAAAAPAPPRLPSRRARRLRQQEGGREYLAVAELDGDSIDQDMRLIGSSLDKELVFKLLAKAMWALRPRLAEAQQRAFDGQADVWRGAEGQQLLEQVISVP